ncbi:MAG: DUF5906 domain-containing protein [Pseudomonadota bacterium]
MAKPGHYTGLGIALGLDTFDNLQGIDLDNIETNHLQDLADSLPGLVELSPSGQGVHALGMGNPFRTLGSNKSGIEAYSEGRFFTVTGKVLRGSIEDLAPFVNDVLVPRHARVNGKAYQPTEAWADLPNDSQVKDLRSALASLRSDDRDLWTRIGLALATAGERGRALWFEWSQTSDKYDPVDAARVWESFHPTNTHWRSVFVEAQKNGWVNPASKDPMDATHRSLNAALVGEVRAGNFIRIAEIHAALFAIRGGAIPPEHVAIVRGVMACCEEGQKLLAEWWKMSMPGETPTPPSWRNLPGTLFRLASRDYGWQSDSLSLDNEGIQRINQQRKRTIYDVNRRWTISNIEGKAAFIEKIPSQAFDRWEFRFSSPDTASKVFQPLQVPRVKTREGKPPSLTWDRLYPLWEKMRSRRTYYNCCFHPKPGVINKPSPDLPSGQVLELFTGLAIHPKHGNCTLILAHIFEVWCSSDKVAFAFLMGWLARMYQKPHERGHTAIVFKSGEGIGKNILLDFLVAAWGRHGITISDSAQVIGKFNDHLSTSIMVFLNEAIWGGDRAHEGALKRLITDETLEVERKYIPRFEVRNCVHLVIASNNDWAVPVGLDDRRFFILDVSEARKGDHEYFALLANEIRNGGAAAFIHLLLKWDISGFNPRDIPRGLACASRTHADQKLRTANSAVKWWCHCLEVGFIRRDTKYEVVYEAPSTWDTDGATLDKSDAFDAYAEWCRLHSLRTESVTAWTQSLKRFGVVVGDNVKVPGNCKRRGIRVDPLPTMRGAAGQVLGKGFLQ